MLENRNQKREKNSWWQLSVLGENGPEREETNSEICVDHVLQERRLFKSENRNRSCRKKDFSPKGELVLSDTGEEGKMVH